ncbi:hypothetical protein [Streptomyces prunicolor]|uniref:hypothetical protein n=1 Tax=Streptomyces prunicolor TaxID=67348 RepID=UPI00343E3FD2
MSFNVPWSVHRACHGTLNDKLTIDQARAAYTTWADTLGDNDRAEALGLAG